MNIKSFKVFINEQTDYLYSDVEQNMIWFDEKPEIYAFIIYEDDDIVFGEESHLNLSLLDSSLRCSSFNMVACWCIKILK